MTVAELRIDGVIVACAVSAGIHAALAPEHFRETAAAGIGFVVAAVVLGLLAVVLTLRPGEPAFSAAALVFAGLIGSYALAITTGIPVLHPDVDPVEGLALATKAIEAAALVLAVSACRPSQAPHSLTQPKGTLT
jgi:peptidoglycan/LPS O-acetylase OafA/YrhL